MMIEITVPATSANLGSGFDSMGVALTLYNRIIMEESDRIEITALNGYQVKTNRENLIYRTADKLYTLCGRKLEGLKIIEDPRIPKTRGLGSSSACIVAAALGANHFMGNPLSLQELVDFAAAEEGHPDNSTPALVGGLVASVMEGSRVHYVKIPFGKPLQFAALIPDFSLKTGHARAALPESVSYNNACFNIARVGLFAASIAAGKTENLKAAMADRMHQPYRFSMIPGGEELIEELLSAGVYGACISGAGPTVLAVGEQGESFRMQVEQIIKERCSTWRAEFLSCDEKGAQVSVINE